MSRLLINEPPLQVLPSLAVKVGLNEAIVLQQVHYWAERSKVEVDGHLWVYNTIQQWREQFPFWSDDTIGRALKSLRESGLVIAARLSKDPFNKTLYYRIDYRNLQASEDAWRAASTPATCGNRKGQDASFSITETTVTETTPEKPSRKRAEPAKPSAKKLTPQDLKTEGVDESYAEAWLQMRKEKRLPLTEGAWKITKEDGAKCGLDAAATVRECLSRGWAAFRADWYGNRQSGFGRQHDPEERDRLAMALLWPDAHGSNVIEGDAR